MLGEMVVCVTVSPHLYTPSVQCYLPSGRGSSCIPASETAVMEFVM